jgi:hypothetical protein
VSHSPESIRKMRSESAQRSSRSFSLQSHNTEADRRFVSHTAIDDENEVILLC